MVDAAVELRREVQDAIAALGITTPHSSISPTS